MATKRLKIKLEKHELKIVRFGRSRKVFCEKCQAETQHLTIGQVANALNISEKNVFQLVESEQVHSVETTDGKLMICKAALLTKFSEINK